LPSSEAPTGWTTKRPVDGAPPWSGGSLRRSSSFRVYVDGSIAISESFGGRAEADAWFTREVVRLRREDSRFRPSMAELAAMPRNTDEDEDPRLPE
jgi:hypothetical protein